MNDKYLQLVWLAGEDPVKISAYEKMPVVDYYILLNKKMEDISKDKKKADSKRR